MAMDPNKVKFWFTHETTKYEIIGTDDHSDRFSSSTILKKVNKTNQSIRLDWNDCTLDIIGKFKDKKDGNKEKLRIALRSKSTKKSEYMGNLKEGAKTVELRYMLGINVFDISKILVEDYQLSEDNYIIREHIEENLSLQENKDQKRQRIGFHIDERYWIWNWYDGSKIENNPMYTLHQYITKNKENADEIKEGTFKINFEDNELDQTKIEKSNVIPIIYQPALDSLKNYVRQVHCAEIEPNKIYEISIVFNNEVLRRHKILDDIYRWFRRVVYHRTTDIETIRIRIDDSSTKVKNKCLFENIYSDDFGIEYDNIHGDPPTAVFRDLKYSHMDLHSPIIFVNTSNHAMAAHDNNHDIWKWEYIPFIKNSPIEFGTLNRKELEEEINEAGK